MAFGVMFQARRMGTEVPAELSIIGIDDHQLSEAVGLSTVGPQPLRPGEAGIKMLLDERAGQHGALRTVVAPRKLIVRQSTALPAIRC